jgi:hypothetical protein
MIAVQHQLAFARPLAARVRSVRRPFRPSAGEGGYRLPHEVRDRLAAALAPFRNREAAFALAVFLARFWSMPGRVALPFPIDRRALAGHRELGLTEGRLRGAIRVLEEVGFLDRALSSGSNYKPTEDGLHRKPIPFVFGSQYAPLFVAANRRAAAARERGSQVRTSDGASRRGGASVTSAGALSGLNLPKSTKPSERGVIMGKIGKASGIPPQASVPKANLEAALERLRKAAGIAGDGSGEGGAR